MKKTLSILTLLMTPLSFTGCWDEVKTEAELLKEDTTKAYDNLKQEVEDLSNQITETKEKVEETANDLQEAKDAIQEVFE